MNAPTSTLEPEVEVTSGELVLLNEQTTLQVLTDEKRFDDLLAKIKAEVSTHVPDLATDKGRKAIASLAFKVTKTKTALDEAGKKLTEDKRKEIAVVDASRRKIREKLDELRDEVRKPLTDWIEAEQARGDRVKAALALLERLAQPLIDDDSDSAAERLAQAQAVEITADEFRETFEIAEAAKAKAVETLTTYHARLIQQEVERAELARLRREAEEREKAEAEARRIDDLASQMLEYIRQVGLGMIGGSPYPYASLIRELEEKIVIDETFGARREEVEWARVETLAAVNEAFRKQQERAQVEEEARQREEAARAKQEAADAAQRAADEAARRAREEAEAQAKAAQEEQDRKHREELAAAQRRAEEAEAARLAEAEAQAKREADAKAQADAEAAAKAKREADAKHRATVMGAAKEALMKHAGIDEEAARQAVLAIRAGEVPHVTITF